MPVQQKNVRTPSDAVEAMCEALPMLQALMGGTAAMRAAGKAFLPQFPAEDSESYQNRLNTAVLYPVYSRTCTVLASKPFSEELELNGYSAKMMEWLRDADKEGTPFQAFAQSVAMNAIAYGVEAVQVDYSGDGTARTKAEEIASGERPYLVRWPLGTVLGWKRDSKTGELLQIRLLETATEPDGEYHDKPIEQVRVLTPGRWEVWRKADQLDEFGQPRWLLSGEGETSLKRIPVVMFYGRRGKGYGVGAPLMTDLAYQNVEHWQSASDQQSILHVARVPILFAKGFGDGDALVIGASTACRSNAEHASLQYVEHSGAAITAGKQSLDDLEERMRKTGAEVLTVAPQNKTATQAGIEADASKSILQAFAENLQDSLTDLVNLMAEFVKEPTGEVKIKTEFNEAPELESEGQTGAAKGNAED